MIPCPAAAFPAERGATIWTSFLDWGLSSGLDVLQHLGTPSGWHGRPVEMTAKKARAEYWCNGRLPAGPCRHVIAKGALHGATGTGSHYCGCCVTTGRPEDQYRSARAA